MKSEKKFTMVILAVEILAIVLLHFSKSNHAKTENLLVGKQGYIQYPAQAPFTLLKLK